MAGVKPLKRAGYSALRLTSTRGLPSIPALHEADVSAQQSSPQAHTRVPCADADAFRTRRSLGAATQGAQKTLGVNPGPAARETFFRSDRLRKRREFEECYASGVRMSGRHLQLFLLSRKAAGPARFGVSVSRRLGGAVTRNRLRRRLREIFRRNREVFGSGPFDCVVNLRASAVGAAFYELEQDCLSAVRRAVEKIRKPR